MNDKQIVAKRILKMIEAKETNMDVFARDAGTLAQLELNIDELNEEV